MDIAHLNTGDNTTMCGKALRAFSGDRILSRDDFLSLTGPPKDLEPCRECVTVGVVPGWYGL